MDESPSQLVVTADDYKRLVESVPDYAILILDQSGNVATWNLGAERIFGYRANEIVGRHFSILYPRDDVDAQKPSRELETTLAEGRAESEGWRLRRDESVFWASSVLTTLHDDAGGLRGYACVLSDLTHRREAEEALRQSEERFHGLVDAVTDYAVFMLDADGNVATWNEGARRAKGYSADEIVGRHFSTFYTAEDRAAGRPNKLLDKVRRDGRIEDEGWRVRKDGTRFWANVIITRRLDTNGNIVGFAKVTRDLTERRAAEATERRLLVEQTKREAAELIAAREADANRVKDEFLATVSHELRTPLNAILGWSKMLLARSLDPMVERGMEVIDRNATAQVKLVEDILDVSRIITGKLRIETQPLDLVAVVRDAVDTVRPAALAKRIAIELTHDEPAFRLVGDPERLRQVAWNLLSNAVKFTPSGGWIRVAMRQEDSRIVLRVADNGRGIDPRFLPQVFDRFKQEEGSISRRVGGLGLGLALVRHIVELHGGTVSVESKLAEGSTFTVLLPIRAVSSQSPDEPGGDGLTQSSRQSTLAGVRALVVDDDADARELVSTALSESGAEVISAGSARDALTAFAANRFDVVVSDIGMPEEDGFVLMRRIREYEATKEGAVPAIALSAYTRLEDQRKAMGAGFTSYLAKPVDPVDLVRTTASLVRLNRR